MIASTVCKFIPLSSKKGGSYEPKELPLDPPLTLHLPIITGPVQADPRGFAVVLGVGLDQICLAKFEYNG